jgi:hypothetical protein
MRVCEPVERPHSTAQTAARRAFTALEPLALPSLHTKFVFPAVAEMKLLDTSTSEKTHLPGNSRLWPSDHAALAAKLKFD